MLNIITKPKISTFQMSSTLFENYINFYMPRSFEGLSFKMVVTDETIRLIVDKSGISFYAPKQVGKGKTFKIGFVSFPKKEVPFKTFRSSKVKFSATWDGNVIEFERPVYTPKVETKKTESTKNKKSFSVLGAAIDKVNMLAAENNCRLYVEDGFLRGEIIVSV